jgi:hypothetical protein
LGWRSRSDVGGYDIEVEIGESLFHKRRNNRGKQDCVGGFLGVLSGAVDVALW